MHCKAAILIDGGYFQYAAKAIIGTPPNNENILQFAKACAEDCGEIFRVFYYNSYKRASTSKSGSMWPGFPVGVLLTR